MTKKKTITEYAIVDIETTGGNALGSRMTEIAIRIYDGQRVTEHYETLINPERDIPPAIWSLTGIDNELVRDAPVFDTIAEQVHHLLQGRVFVAHNVNFDYSFIKHQLDEAGYKWAATKLCTVRMSRKIRPGLRSYSLGNLCDTLGIPLENRHRAGGDVDATTILFSRLLEWDTEDMIPEMLKRNSKEQQLPPNLSKEDFDTLPSRPGIYYFLDRTGKPIYVGKAINIKKRVFSHFSGHNPNPQRQHFLRSIYNVSYEVCATELMAFLLECAEIKRLWPAYNRALKRFEPKFGLYCYEDMGGFMRLAIGKLVKYHSCIQAFNRAGDAVNLLNKLIRDFGICRQLCTFGLAYPNPGHTSVEAESSLLPSITEHNHLVAEALEHLANSLPTFALIDKGRHPEERSCIWVEHGNFYAMGYIDQETHLSHPEDIRDSLCRYEGNHYMMQLIYAYAEKYPGKVLHSGVLGQTYRATIADYAAPEQPDFLERAPVM